MAKLADAREDLAVSPPRIYVFGHSAAERPRHSSNTEPPQTAPLFPHSIHLTPYVYLPEGWGKRIGAQPIYQSINPITDIMAQSIYGRFQWPPRTHRRTVDLIGSVAIKVFRWVCSKYILPQNLPPKWATSIFISEQPPPFQIVSIILCLFH
jgi:hypothetical protein